MEAATFNDIHVKYSSVITSDSPPSTSVDLPNSSPKRRRGVVKRVVKVAMKDLDGSHFNKQGEYCTNPPADSWAWRKYGQKPIKGSPYPRGYYRCSSSKGCPARKQVERSRSDPSFLVITYSHDHNHSLPVANSRSLKNAVTTTAAAAAAVVPAARDGPGCKAEEKLADLAGDLEALITAEDFSWSLADLEMTSAIFEGSIFSRSGSGVDDDLAGYFPMREEDACESFFADLGELPECSVVFGATAAKEEERIPRAAAAAAPWCSTTG